MQSILLAYKDFDGHILHESFHLAGRFSELRAGLFTNKELQKAFYVKEFRFPDRAKYGNKYKDPRTSMEFRPERPVIRMRGSMSRIDMISKIVTAFPPGAVVTTPRSEVDYIVTEYGAAHLRGKTVPARVRETINIAHPDFREQLRKDAKEKKFLID